MESAVWLVWLAGVRDLQWRLRRFVIAIGAAALVFALTLLMTGIRRTIDVEVSSLVSDLRAEGFVIQESSEGPFSSAAPVPEAAAEAILGPGGAAKADPIVVAAQLILAPERDNVIVVGHRPGGLGTPQVRTGRAAQGEEEAVVDTSLGLAIDETFQMSGRTFKVVGLVSGKSVNLGVPIVYVHLADAQAAVFGGQPFATTILTDVVAQSVPDGLRSVTPSVARQDLLRPLKPAARSISVINLFLWGVAAAIIGSVLYISVLERTRDLAVFKAVGANTRDLGAALAVQAVSLALTAAVAASILAVIAKPAFPLRITLTAASFGGLVVVAVVVGLLGTLVGLRRAVAIEPTAAFRGP